MALRSTWPPWCIVWGEGGKGKIRGNCRFREWCNRKIQEFGYG